MELSLLEEFFRSIFELTWEALEQTSKATKRMLDSTFYSIRNGSKMFGRSPSFFLPLVFLGTASTLLSTSWLWGAHTGATSHLPAQTYVRARGAVNNALQVNSWALFLKDSNGRECSEGYRSSRTALHAKVNEPQKIFHGYNASHKLKWVRKEQEVSVHSRSSQPKERQILSVALTVIVILFCTETRRKPKKEVNICNPRLSNAQS